MLWKQGVKKPSSSGTRGTPAITPRGPARDAGSRTEKLVPAPVLPRNAPSRLERCFEVTLFVATGTCKTRSPGILCIHTVLIMEIALLNSTILICACVNWSQGSASPVN